MAELSGRPSFFRNPVFKRAFPDPFVLKFGDRYYGYATGFAYDGENVFPIITSPDLVEWEYAGPAMAPLGTKPPLYWAPEVTYSNGRFYLYYSTGNEINMELRLAVSARPDGGFVDSGVRLTSEQFAIDPHVFIDDDGQKYLFYATDFLGHSHIGTGTVVDRLLDWDRLEGRPRPVTRARFDWQVYDPCRKEKGGVRWHTVEGPAVIKRKGKYFEMYSGGNWQTEGYGVGYAVAGSISDPDEWEQHIDGSSRSPILRTCAGEVEGPGHNSIVSGPNSRELFCVYHSWVNGERVMSIDRMDAAGDRIFVNGPSITPQPRPFRPRRPEVKGRAGKQTDTLHAENISSDHFVEITLRIPSPEGRSELMIGEIEGPSVTSFWFELDKVSVAIGDQSVPTVIDLRGADLREFQSVWIEANAGQMFLFVNRLLCFESRIPVVVETASLRLSLEGDVEVLNAEITEGFVDLFDRPDAASSGWTTLPPGHAISVQDGAIGVSGHHADTSVIAVKGSCYEEFEFAANIRLGEGRTGSFGFALLSQDDLPVVMFTITSGDQPRLAIEALSGNETVSLPHEFSASEYQQFRFVKIGETLTFDLEGSKLAETKVDIGPSRIGIVVYGDGVSVEMARSIRIGPLETESER